MSEPRGHTQTDDHGQRVDGSGSNVKVVLTGDSKVLALFVALIVALVITLPVSVYSLSRAQEAADAASRSGKLDRDESRRYNDAARRSRA